MKEQYTVSELCRSMSVNRSGYYKWKNRKGIKNKYEKDRELLTSLLKEAHAKHKSYGYHKLAKMVREDTGWVFSDNLAHKCCKYAGIKAIISHYNWRNKKIGEENKQFPNIVNGEWNADEPLKLIASDMTVIKYKGVRYEWTYLLDTFNNEIVSSHISSKQGDRRPYFSCLNDLIDKTKEQKSPVTLHTDQGTVYSSAAFFNAHKNCNIIRSMSRVGTPTDNPVIESINGWIKAEIYSEGWHKKYSSAKEMVDEYVKYYNNERPVYALQYKSPVQYKTEMGFV